MRHQRLAEAASRYGGGSSDDGRSEDVDWPQTRDDRPTTAPSTTLGQSVSWSRPRSRKELSRAGGDCRTGDSVPGKAPPGSLGLISLLSEGPGVHFSPAGLSRLSGGPADHIEPSSSVAQQFQAHP